jgi:putative tryptophan/tyrosine transport system substrate-binding protein
VRRREFVAGLGSAVAWPDMLLAQKRTIPTIGFLNAGSQNFVALSAFFKGLQQRGYSEDRNVRIEYRWADGQFDRLPTMAVELVQREVAVIVAAPASLAVSAAKASTSTIPIVFITGIDPVRVGFVTSLRRPGGNMTGVYNFSSTLESKRLEMLRKLLPDNATIALLINPSNTNAESERAELQNLARSIGQRLLVLRASNDSELDNSFVELVRQSASGLMVGSDTFFASRSSRIASLAHQYAIPGIGEVREYVDAGLLMSYGTSRTDYYHQAGVYTGRILSGESPGDLPIVQPTRFEFVINLKSAKALGIQVPSALLAIADEVIE